MKINKNIYKIICLAIVLGVSLPAIVSAEQNQRPFVAKKSLVDINAKTQANKNHKTKENKTLTNSVKSKASEKINAILSYAKKFRGVPYHFGGSTSHGFDCSGYLRYVFQQTLGINLPHDASLQYKLGTKISRRHLEPGDLVFFSTYLPGISHSGIYVGNGDFISATSSSGVMIASLDSGYWKEHYRGATRIL